MSSKPRARRNRPEKKFIDQEDGVVGVEEENSEANKNKIQEKQEDMFDPHKLQQNILHHAGQSYTNNLQPFVDFQEQQTISHIQPFTQPLEEPKREEPKREEDTGTKKRKRERGRREVKKFDDDENQQGEQNEVPKKESMFQNEELEEAPQEIQKREVSEKKQEPDEKEQQELKAQQQRMKMMVSKKTPIPVSNYIHIHTLLNKAGVNKEQRRRAIFTPLDPNQYSFVYFKRYSSGFTDCYQAIGQDQRPILFCENQRGCIGCNYYISLTKEMDKNNPSYLGKLRGNASGSIYQLYDNGLQPNNDYDRSKFRVSMGYIEYESNFLGMKGPRKLKAVVPRINHLQDFDMFKFSEEESLGEFSGSNVIKFRNKSPRWNEKLKSYALNFGGRVKQASIKNFILIDDSFSLQDEDKAPNVIIFGKIDDSTFALQFGHPLSLFQAFGIAMSEFDFKLKCE